MNQSNGLVSKVNTRYGIVSEIVTQFDTCNGIFTLRDRKESTNLLHNLVVFGQSVEKTVLGTLHQDKFRSCNSLAIAPSGVEATIHIEERRPRKSILDNRYYSIVSRHTGSNDCDIISLQSLSRHGLSSDIDRCDSILLAGLESSQDIVGCSIIKIGYFRGEFLVTLTDDELIEVHTTTSCRELYINRLTIVVDEFNGHLTSREELRLTLSISNTTCRHFESTVVFTTVRAESHRQLLAGRNVRNGDCILALSTVEPDVGMQRI